MKQIISLLIAISAVSPLALCQNQRPTVDIISAQSTTILYSLNDAENDAVNIEVQYSCDGGNSFEVMPFDVLSGDFGYPIVANGSNKTVNIAGNWSDGCPNPVLRLVADDYQPIDIQSVVDEVSHDRLVADMNTVEGIRHFIAGATHLQEVRDTIVQRFVQHGLDTLTQNFVVGTLPGVNIVGTKQGHGTTNKLYIVDAHYDSVNIAPGADDNGSGVIGVLEAMRVLSQYEFNENVKFIGFDLEEAGLIGSHYFLQNGGIPANQTLNGVLNFEMIGYYSDVPNSQQLPAGFNLLFPNQYAAIQANQFRGDFIANIANVASNPLKAAYDSLSAIYVPNLNIQSIALPGNAQIAPDFRRSDHATFWDAGYQALMLTDGANFRNLNYHTAQDVSANLDYDFITNNTKAVVATVAALAGIRHSGAATVAVDPIGVPNKLPLPLQLSPNPAQQYTYLQLAALPADQGSLQITNLQGQLVQQSNIDTRQSATWRISTQTLPKGMYFVRFLGKKHTAIAQLVVQ